jgi:hypothetical protein
MLFRAFCAGALAAFCVAGCNSDDGPRDAGSCPSDVPDACVQPAPTWAAVLPIIQARCGSCHKEDAGQWPLNEYQYVIDWEPSFVGDIVACTMPPADAGIELTQDERTTLLNWIACGAPQ